MFPVLIPIIIDDEDTSRPPFHRSLKIEYEGRKEKTIDAIGSKLSNHYFNKVEVEFDTERGNFSYNCGPHIDHYIAIFVSLIVGMTLVFTKFTILALVLPELFPMPPLFTMDWLIVACVYFIVVPLMVGYIIGIIYGDIHHWKEIYWLDCSISDKFIYLEVTSYSKMFIERFIDLMKE